jgi:hypothetical protein
MPSFSFTSSQGADNWTRGETSPRIACTNNESDFLLDQYSDVGKSCMSCNSGSGKFATESPKQDKNAWTHFGQHLQKKLQSGLGFGSHRPNKCALTTEELVNPAQDEGDLFCGNVKDNILSHKRVIPFCKELVKFAERQQKSRERRFKSRKWRMIPTAHQEYFDFGSTPCPCNKQNLPHPKMTPTQYLESQLEHFDVTQQNFKKPDLSYDQITDLDSSGLPVSKFLPKVNVTVKPDPRIPTSFDCNGTSCYWCETQQHVAYGVAFILKEDVRVIGVEVERNRLATKVVLIQIATTDVVLLIPTNSFSISAPKALHFIFRDSEIFKVGVNIEENLRALWVDFQIESNSFVELNELVQFSAKKFGSFPGIFEGPLDLPALASFVGYQDWGCQELMSTNWESRLLSTKQVEYAARNASMTILVFWTIALGHRVIKPLVSDLQLKVKDFVKPIYIKGPISKWHGYLQLKLNGPDLGFVGLYRANKNISYKSSIG